MYFLYFFSYETYLFLNWNFSYHSEFELEQVDEVTW